MQAIVNIALRAGRDAAEILAQNCDRLDRVLVLDDSPGSFVTSAHKDADRSILYHLQKSYPQHSFFSRVSGHIAGAEGQPVWLIDALIGGRNFIRGFPAFAVSIACLVDGKLSHAVLIDPLQDEEYSASRGDGAYVNNRRLRVKSREDLSGGLIALPGNIANTSIETYLHFVARMNEMDTSWRTTGCTGLDIVHTAAGRLDGGWAPNPGKLSTAAAALIIQEAGGLLTDTKGSPDFFDSDFLVFGNPRCLKQLLKIAASSL
ncbi:MAG: inositol monophosphatase family protein [Pseudohongiellaceae bacterium]